MASKTILAVGTKLLYRGLYTTKVTKVTTKLNTTEVESYTLEGYAAPYQAFILENLVSRGHFTVIS